MKIGIQTWGSRGDIRPFIALAEGLQASKHDVTLVISCVDSERYNNYISSNGLKIKIVGTPVMKDKMVLSRIIQKVYNTGNPLLQVKLILSRLFIPIENEMYEAAENLCKNNDLVIGHYLHYPMRIASEIFKIPYISVSLAHILIPLKKYPPHGFLNFGRLMNSFLWKLVRFVLNITIKRYSDKLRAAKGLKPSKDLINDVWTSKFLNLIAISKELCPLQAEWGNIHKVCGFFDMPKDVVEEKIPEDLEKFINAGAPPVYMSFGSMMPSEITSQKKTIEIFIHAAKIANCRAIIQASLCEETGFKNSEIIYFVKESPHTLVLPRCKAIVHHGGAGTTQSAALEGIPSIVVYHISEQKFWGDQLKKLGLTTGVISRKRLTSKKLGKCIRDLLANPLILEKSRVVGSLMKKENGVQNAIEIIHSTFHVAK
ncbi:MAG: glycosyltransferase [Spirochaetia bacterium]|nr:glycosyltransferase [Spirochaetia bacterium]